MKQITRSSPSVPAVGAPYPESVFYEDKQVLVSISRAIFDGQTFAIANISSVAAVKMPLPIRGKVYMLALAALLFIVQNPLCTLIGWIAVFAAAVGLFTMSRDYLVVLTAAGGEIRALQSNDRRRVLAIINAVNQAIVAQSSLHQAAYFHTQRSHS